MIYCKRYIKVAINDQVYSIDGGKVYSNSIDGGKVYSNSIDGIVILYKVE